MLREDALPEGLPDGGIPGAIAGQDEREAADGRGHRLPEAVRKAQSDLGRACRGKAVQEPSTGHGTHRPDN